MPVERPKPYAVQLYYRNDSCETLHDFQERTLTDMRELFKLFDVDRLLEKEFPQGNRTSRDATFFDKWWREAAAYHLVTRVKLVPERRALLCEDPDLPGSRVLNSFAGSMRIAYDPDFVIDYDLLNLLLRRIFFVWCRQNICAYTFLFRFIAHMLLRPERKGSAPFAVLLKGPQGVGKNIVWDMIATEIIGKSAYAYTQGTERLESNFNAFLERVLLLVVDEVHAVNDRGECKTKIVELFKSLISQADYLMEKKFWDAVLSKLICRIVLLTNHAIPMIVPMDDRRDLLLDCEPRHYKRHPGQKDLFVRACTENGAALARNLLHYVTWTPGERLLILWGGRRGGGHRGPTKVVGSWRLRLFQR